MRRITYLLFFLCAPFLFGQTGQNAGPAAELITLEKKRSEAIAAHDTVFLNNLYADDFRGVTAIGYEVDKKTLMIVFTRDNPQTKFTLDQLQARVLGDTAIVTGRLTGKDSTSGKTVHESLYIHVYEKRNAVWKLIAGQGTMVQRQLFPPEQK